MISGKIIKMFWFFFKFPLLCLEIIYYIERFTDVYIYIVLKHTTIEGFIDC